MSNLIRYIIQEDPEKQMKKNDLDYTKYSTSWAPIQKQSQEEKYKGYKFSSKNLLENSFNSLTSNKSSQSKDEGSFMGGISNIFNNIKSDTKSSSNASLPQSIAKTAAEESTKIGTFLSPKPIGNDNASYKITQNNKGNTADNTKEVMLNKYQKLIDKHFDEVYKSEGNPNYIYLDPKYIKTIGRGENINTFDAFDKINFKNKKSRSIATEQEKIDAFNNFENWIKENKKTDKHNYKASYFENLSDLYIEPDEEKRLHTEHVLNDMPVIKNIIKNYDELSFEKQLAILDMAYNLGTTKFNDQFQNFIKAANANSEEGMLAEYHRKGISEERNKWTADLLKK